MGEILERSSLKPGRACIEAVPDESAWESISVPEGHHELVRSTKYFLPWRNDVRIPTSFLDANTWITMVSFREPVASANPLHMLFATVFLTTTPPWNAYTGADREAVTGNFFELAPEGQGRSYGYTVHDPAFLSCDQQKQVHQEIRAAFALGPLNRLVLMTGDEPPAGCQIPLLVIER
jgi:hypothetical protein